MMVEPILSDQKTGREQFKEENREKKKLEITKILKS